MVDNADQSHEFSSPDSTGDLYCEREVQWTTLADDVVPDGAS